VAPRQRRQLRRIIARENAGRSRGLRLDTQLSSNITSAFCQSPPALRTSSGMPGHDASRRALALPHQLGRFARAMRWSMDARETIVVGRAAWADRPWSIATSCS